MTAPDRRPAHRPVTLPPGTRRVTVNLTADAIATARRLGDGNLSEGVRQALAARQKFPIDSTADVV